MSKSKLEIIIDNSLKCPVHQKSDACLSKKPFKKTENDSKCIWWINSKKHDYCFWTYINSVSDENGVMPELIQSQLAELFGWSNTKTYFILKQAMQELHDTFNKHYDPKYFKELADSDIVTELQDLSYKFEAE